MCLSQDKIQRPVNMASLAIALQDILKRKNVWLSRTSNRSQSSRTGTCGISLGGGARNSSWGIFLWITKKTCRKSRSTGFLPHRRPLVLGPPPRRGCTSRCPGRLLLCQEESLLVLLVGLVDIGRVELRDLQRIAAFVTWFTCPYKVFLFSGIPKVCQRKKTLSPARLEISASLATPGILPPMRLQNSSAMFMLATPGYLAEHPSTEYSTAQ